MTEPLDRRRLIAAVPALGIAAAFPARAHARLGTDAERDVAEGVPDPPAVSELFPTQEAELAREMVGVSHGRIDRVRELLALRPSLARATWDWGFGDWESALGAASHVGHREIAELLLAHGARPDLFAAAMLGQLETVQAFVAAQPGCQRIPGPHGIPLLAHARAGGERAAAVVAYLESIGGADERPATAPLADSERDALTGAYRFGPGERGVVTVAVGRFGLEFERAGTAARNLSHVGGRAFFPAGAPAVRIRFAPAAGVADEIRVHDPDLVLVARRVSS